MCVCVCVRDRESQNHCCAPCIRVCTCRSTSWGSECEWVCVFPKVGHGVNVQPLKHADTDTESRRQLSAMVTGVAAEMVQLLHGYFRLTSVHNQATPHPLSLLWADTAVPDIWKQECKLWQESILKYTSVFTLDYYLKWMFDKSYWGYSKEDNNLKIVIKAELTKWSISVITKTTNLRCRVGLPTLG